MEMITFWTVLITFLTVVFGGFIFLSGFLFGRKFGKIKGYDQAIKDLLLTKNTEAWEMARMLEVERIEKQKIKKNKTPTSTITTTIARESRRCVDTSTDPLIRKTNRG